MQRACKAFALLIACSLLLTLLYSLLDDVEHVGPRRVKMKSRYDGLHLKDYLSTEQLNYHPEPQPHINFEDQSQVIENPLQLRRDQLMKECKSLSIDGSEFHNINKSQLGHIIVNDKHKTLYCYVPKVACTNLKRLFLILTGEMNVTDPLKLSSTNVHKELDDYLTYLDTLSPKGIKYRIRNYRKIIFVREPMERILSAYRNKFLQKGNEYFKDRYAKRIIKMFRENPSDKSLKTGHDMKFSEFVDYILHPKTQTQGFNEHWDTYYNLCSPCHIQYNFIGNYETLDEDVDALLREISADNMVEFPKRGATYKAMKTEDTLEKFYRDIDPNKIRKLQKVYSLDYTLFGYQLPETLQKFVNVTSSTSP